MVDKESQIELPDGGPLRGGPPPNNKLPRTRGELFPPRRNRTLPDITLSRLHDGSNTSPLVSPSDPGGAGWTKVACGNHSGAALGIDGEVIEWGGRNLDPGFQVPPHPIGNYSFIDAGAENPGGIGAPKLRDNYAVITPQGDIEVWGALKHGQANVPRRELLPPGEEFVEVAVNHSVMVAMSMPQGLLYGWGEETVGGILADLPHTAAPGIRAIRLGTTHGVAINRIDGREITWGDARAMGDRPPPPAGTGSLGQMNKFVQVAAGHLFSIGLREDGTIAQWGDTTAMNRTSDSGSPSLIDPPKGVYAYIAAGPRNAAAITGDGRIVVWGNDERHQITNSPSHLDVPQGFIDIALGTSWACAITTDLRLFSWGTNGARQVSDTPGGYSMGVGGNAQVNSPMAEPQTFHWHGYRRPGSREFEGGRHGHPNFGLPPRPGGIHADPKPVEPYLKEKPYHGKKQ